MVLPEHIQRFETALRSGNPAEEIPRLAASLRDEGVSQGELYVLFERFLTENSGNDPTYDAIADSMDLIWSGPWTKGKGLFPTELTDIEVMISYPEEPPIQFGMESVDELVKAWIAGEHTMFDACLYNPENAWAATLLILERDLSPEDKAVLAAGPLETLLARHGPAFIDRVEERAGTDERFNHLHGGVWQSQMTQDVWDRVQKVRKTVW